MIVCLTGYKEKRENLFNEVKFNRHQAELGKTLQSVRKPLEKTLPDNKKRPREFL